MAEMSCEMYQALLPEVALGVLHGRERAEALAHVEHCPACQHELLLMGDLADRLVELTPSAEPPAGFETRVLSHLGVPSPAIASPSADHERSGGGIRSIATARARRRLRPAMLALAAACLAVAVGIGGWAIGHNDGAAQRVPASAGHARVANLVADHHTVGQVVVTDGGEPWVSMAMNTTFGNQKITCELREQNGKTVSLGSFELKNGYGYWAAPIPVTTSPVVGAQLVGAHGATLATAAVSVSAFGR